MFAPDADDPEYIARMFVADDDDPELVEYIAQDVRCR
jgi:hypothetical protein